MKSEKDIIGALKLALRMREIVQRRIKEEDDYYADRQDLDAYDAELGKLEKELE